MEGNHKGDPSAQTPTTDESYSPLRDLELNMVAAELSQIIPTPDRLGQVLRNTWDQIYDGQNSGRYRVEQLMKTEKTHIGSLVEINIQRELEFASGTTLDFEIAGQQVDCKFSLEKNWMIPPEAFNQIIMLVWANDKEAEFSVGLVRAVKEYRNSGANRDRKTTLNKRGRENVMWIIERAALPPNALLQLPEEDVNEILGKPSGQARINELLRRAQGMLIGRAVIATVAQQLDPMKRLRRNGGARSHLANEGLLILSGMYNHEANIAEALAVPRPNKNEIVSVKVAPCTSDTPDSTLINGSWWHRIAPDTLATEPAPIIPHQKATKSQSRD